MRKAILLTIACLFFVNFHVGRIKPVCHIIQPEEPPIKIDKYEAEYKSGKGVGEEGIHHELNYQNMTSRKVVAVEFKFVSYSIWDEYLDTLSGLRIKDIWPYTTGQIPDDAHWIQKCVRDFSFHTGFVFLSRVRFENGDIWTADRDMVLSKIRDFDITFDASEL
jgi:hypothetical protein